MSDVQQFKLKMLYRIFNGDKLEIPSQNDEESDEDYVSRLISILTEERDKRDRQEIIRISRKIANKENLDQADVMFMMCCAESDDKVDLNNLILEIENRMNDDEFKGDEEKMIVADKLLKFLRGGINLDEFNSSTKESVKKIINKTV